MPLRSTTRHRRRWALRCEMDALDERCLLSGIGGSDVEAAAGLSVAAVISGKSDLDGNGVVQGPRVLITGQTAPGATVRIDRGAGPEYVRTMRANASGQFAFPLCVTVGRTEFQIQASGPDGETAQTTVKVTRGDAAIAWDETLLKAIRTATTGPPQASRALAMVHLAMYNAVNAIDKTGESYHFSQTAPSGASLTAAASQAAYRVLTQLYPNQSATFDLAREESLAGVPNGRAKILGLQIGQAAGDSMIALRANDGANATVAYQPGTDPGDWIPTPPKFLPGAVPQWPNVTPFAMTSASQFRPDAPPALDSAEYAAALNEVKTLGSVNSTARTAEQTAIANFWADLPGVSFTPPGHWHQIAQTASLEKHLSLVENARMFAVLGAAEADAAISCWDGKYFYDFWRPITAIRAADQDGNSQTTADANWSSLLTTPNFPSYASGHSTFSGAAQTALEAFFGKNYSFEDTGELSLNLPARQFSSFQQAADEAGRSRIYGGIHYQFDNAAGLKSGRAIGQFAVGQIARLKTASPS